LKKDYSLTARPGHLRLYGSCYALSSAEAPTLFLRKQTAFQQRFNAVLDFMPTRAGYEAGIVLWYSLFSYASIGVTVAVDGPNKGKRVLIVRVPEKEVGFTSVCFRFFLISGAANCLAGRDAYAQWGAGQLEHSGR
jgi:hypothetical protein